MSKKISFNISQRKKAYEIICKVLSKAFNYKKSFNILCSLLDNYLKKNYKLFLDKFKNFYHTKINFSLKNAIRNTIFPKVSRFETKKIPLKTFYLNKDNNKKEAQNKNIKFTERKSKNRTFIISKKEENKNITINLVHGKDLFYNERLLPYLVIYLNKLRIKRLRISFEYIYDRFICNSFCINISSWCFSKSLIFKKKLVDNIKQNIFKQKILDYMRKSGIKKLTSYYLVIIKKRNDLFILVHRTQVIKRINQLKIALHFIRLWRLYWKLIKERRAQLEKMEKSFNFTYRKISGDIFLDSEEEKSVQTQMMTFIDNVYYEKVERKKRTVFKSLNSFYYTPEKNTDDNLNNNDINIISSDNKTNDLIFKEFDKSTDDEKNKKIFNSSGFKMESSLFKKDN